MTGSAHVGWCGGREGRSGASTALAGPAFGLSGLDHDLVAGDEEEALHGLGLATGLTTHVAEDEAEDAEAELPGAVFAQSVADEFAGTIHGR